VANSWSTVWSSIFKELLQNNEKMIDDAANGGGEESNFRAGNAVDLARRLRKAALEIRAGTATAAPYFWAGFVLYGNGNSVCDQVLAP
jgi:hypothetical protein